jgi:hypothetical protein
MPRGHDERYDFFLSRRGSVATVAREVADVLTEKAGTVSIGIPPLILLEAPSQSSQSV